jgi:hypothetical protein
MDSKKILTHIRALRYYFIILGIRPQLRYDYKLADLI